MLTYMHANLHNLIRTTSHRHTYFHSNAHIICIALYEI